MLFDVPPPRRLPNHHVRVYTVEPGIPISCVKLGPQVGISGHWVAPRFEACLLPEKKCPLHHLRLEWKGFVPCAMFYIRPRERDKRWHQILLCVTEAIGSQTNDWKIGTFGKLQRAGEAKNSRLIFEATNLPGPADLPSSFDPKPLIARALRQRYDFPLRPYRDGVG